MRALRKRSRPAESAANSPQLGNDDQTQKTETQKMSLYEQSREQRIRENRERMEKLGILDLSLKLKSQVAPRRTRTDPSNCKAPQRLATVQPTGPLRRSSRLQNVTPVTYFEVHLKKEDSLEIRKVAFEGGSKPEVYTEEDEKLLGNTDKSWTLFVDGYGKDGRRIYDPIKGKTCHQCRQKTLGYRTQCSKCNMVQGQFCGDCLYMRYGEHVLEALQNPDWICPVCRGICNCSLCRQAKGWAPTGILYKKISALGYKSVAHYLIQTQRSDINAENNVDASNPDSAKRSPPSPDVELVSDQLLEANDSNMNLARNVDASNAVSAKRSLSFPDVGAVCNESLETNENHPESLKPLSESSGNQVSAKRSLVFSDMQSQSENVGCLETVKPLASSDSIAGRLRPRLKKSECDGDQVSAEGSMPILDVQTQCGCLETMKPLASFSKPSSSSVAGRLKSRLKKHDKDVFSFCLT